MRRGMRGLAFIVAALAHVALIALLMLTPAPRETSERIEAPRMVLVSIEPEVRGVTPSPPPAPSLHVPAPHVTEPRVDLSGPITVAPEAAPEAAPPPIDWQRETQTAAARTAEAVEAERQRRGKYAPDPRFARPAPHREFGWDQSKTHRIEALPEGGTLIHLNDRCALVLSGMILPICKLGKIPARGDLFEHMGDSPPGDDAP